MKPRHPLPRRVTRPVFFGLQTPQWTDCPVQNPSTVQTGNQYIIAIMHTPTHDLWEKKPSQNEWTALKKMFFCPPPPADDMPVPSFPHCADHQVGSDAPRSRLAWALLYVHRPTGAMPSFVPRGGSRFSSHRNLRGKWTSSPRMAFSSSAACSGSVSQRRSAAEYSFSSRKLWTELCGRHLKTCVAAAAAQQTEPRQRKKEGVQCRTLKTTKRGGFGSVGYLVIYGGVQFRSFIPGHKEEFVTDGIIDVDTGVWLSSNKDSGNVSEQEGWCCCDIDSAPQLLKPQCTTLALELDLSHSIPLHYVSKWHNDECGKSKQKGQMASTITSISSLELS